MTRRELRELEAARAAAQGGGGPQQPSAPSQSSAQQPAAPQGVAPQRPPAPQPTAQRPPAPQPTVQQPTVQRASNPQPQQQPQQRPQPQHQQPRPPQPQGFVPAAPSRADQPSTPPSSASPVVSRRALREAAPATPPPPGAPVRQTAVRPPTSGAVRGLNPQGGLGEVRPATGANPALPEGHFAQVQPSTAKREPTAPSNPAPPAARQETAPPSVASPGHAPTQAVPRPDLGAQQGGPTRSTAARPQGPGARPERPLQSPVAPGVPVPPIARNPQAPTLGVPAPVAPFVPARPDDPEPGARQPQVAGPHRGAGPGHGDPSALQNRPQAGPHATPSSQWAPSGSLAAPPVQYPPPGRRPQSPTPESGWTPAVSGAVRAPVEPGTLPPGVVAPVSDVPPAGTFIPTGAVPIVAPSQLAAVGGGPLAQRAQPAWDSEAEQAAPAPAWGRLGISPEEIEDDEPEVQHGYTWLHLIVLAVVAFAAGLLVWLLLIQGRGAGTPEGFATGPAESAAGSVGAVSAVVDTPPGEL